MTLGGTVASVVVGIGSGFIGGPGAYPVIKSVVRSADPIIVNTRGSTIVGFTRISPGVVKQATRAAVATVAGTSASNIFRTSLGSGISNISSVKFK